MGRRRKAPPTEPADLLRQLADATARVEAAQAEADAASAGRRDVIRKLRAAGLTLGELAMVTGFSRPHIRRLLSEEG